MSGRAADAAQLSSPSKQFLSSVALLSIAIFTIVLAAVVLLFLQWKQSSTLNSLPLASRDCVEKWDTYLRGKRDPDCLLLGSSVFLVPTVYCEEQRLGHHSAAGEADPTFAKKAIRCDNAPELERQLGRRLHRKITVKNLAVAGSNVSDYLIEVQALQKSGHKPKLIVCGLGVRDFVQSFFRMDQKNNPASKLIVGSGPKAKLDNELISDLREGCVTDILGKPKQWIADMQTVLIKTGEGISLPKTDEEMAIKLTQSLSDAPKHPAFVAAQIEAYKTLISFCQHNNIPLLIVEVPKRTGWAGVIDDKTVDTIETTIVNECVLHNIPYSDIKNGFNPSDFADDIHPNETGGFKLFDKIAAAIIQHGAL